MTTFEHAGHAMAQVQAGNRSLLQDILAFFGRSSAPADDDASLSGYSLIDLEPGLAAEANTLPDHMRTI